MTLLGGYLGAGKTTIVNHVLSTTQRRVVVLVNDVGSVAVDAGLIAARHDDTIELTNGCVCCSLVDGFAVTLETLRHRSDPPDHVLVELSGVAEPHRVAPWASTAGFRLDGVVVAADASQVGERVVDHRVGDLVRTQLRDADLVLVTKSDLVADMGPVETLLAELTEAPRVSVVAGDVPAEVLLGPLDRAGTPITVDRDAGRDRHVTDVVELPVLDPAELLTRVATLPAEVVRAKGVVETTLGPRLVQRVGERVRLTESESSVGPLVVIGLDAAAVARARAQLTR